MIKEVSKKEIKKITFSMDNNKTLGPNGFSAYFYKRAWEVVKRDVTEAIQLLFGLRSLL